MRWRPSSLNMPMAMGALGFACLFTVLAVSATCSDGPPPADAGTADADAGVLHDASRSGDADADAPICDTWWWDGGVISDWPGWRRLTELSPCCMFDVTTDAAMLPPMTWVPCSNGAPGCVEWATDWASDAGVGFFFRAPEVSRASDGSPNNLLLGFPFSSTAAEFGIYDLTTSKTIGGTRFDVSTKCLIGPTLAGPGLTIVGSPTPPTGPLLGACGSPQQVLTTPSFQLLAPSGTLPPMSVVQTTIGSAVRFAFDVQPQGWIEQWPFDAGALTTSTNTTGAALLLDFMDGDDVYAVSVHGTQGWQQEYCVQPDGTVIAYRTSPSAHEVAFATDGTTMFWSEAYGDPSQGWSQPNVDVWSAPYTNDPSTLSTTAKKLTTLPISFTPGVAVAFQGYYATAPNPFTIAYVVRASDGRIQQVAAGPGRQFGPLALVSASELWAVMDQTIGDAGGHVSGVAFARYALAAWP